MSEAIPWLVLAIIVGVLFFRSPDDSDRNWFNRSGMSVYTDERTGLQYLGAGFGGGLTPRVDSFGHHLSDPTWRGRQK